MLYGRTPFRGNNRQKTFANILYKDLTFPSSIPVRFMSSKKFNKHSPNPCISNLLFTLTSLFTFDKYICYFIRKGLLDTCDSSLI